MFYLHRFFSFFIGFLFWVFVFPQDLDGQESLQIEKEQWNSQTIPIENYSIHLSKTNILGVSEEWTPNSTIALLCAIIPGGGQFYNKKYWKIPIVLGITTVCLYAITWNARLYNEYHTAYVDFMNPNPLEKDSWKGFVPLGEDPKNHIGSANIINRLKRGTSLYRRNRDLSIIIFAGVYLLSFVDAYVDAELFNFRVSPKLSMSIHPSVFYAGVGEHNLGAGVSYSLTF